MREDCREESSGVGKKTHMSTRMVIGTHGFMPPEYLTHGYVSPKTDSYVILSILSHDYFTLSNDQLLDLCIVCPVLLCTQVRNGRGHSHGFDG